MVTNLSAESEVSPLVVVSGEDVQRLVQQIILGNVDSTTLSVSCSITVCIVWMVEVLVNGLGIIPSHLCGDEGVLGRSDVNTYSSQEPLCFVVVTVLVKVVQRVYKVCILIVLRELHLNSVRIQPVRHVVNDWPSVSLSQNTVGTLSCLVVGGLGVTHHGVKVQPLGYLSPAGQGDVQTSVIGCLYSTFLIQIGGCTTYSHLVCTALNCYVVGVGESGLEDCLDIVVNLYASVCRIKTSVKSLIVVVGYTVCTICKRCLRLRVTVTLAPGKLVAVSNLTLAGGTLLGGDDDGTVGCI